MPGGYLSKIWYPYGMYGNVDKMYGFKAWNAHEGWTGAQGYINLLETAAYVTYLSLVYRYGEQEPRQGSGAPDRSAMGQFRALSESRTVYGKTAAGATLLAYSAATVTFWKTIIYWLIEAFSGEETVTCKVPLLLMSLRVCQHWAQFVVNVNLLLGTDEVSNYIWLNVDWSGMLIDRSFAWIVVPGYMIYVFGKEILEGLEIAAEGKKSR